jgi:hypothetical protein
VDADLLECAAFIFRVEVFENNELSILHRKNWIGLFGTKGVEC